MHASVSPGGPALPSTMQNTSRNCMPPPQGTVQGDHSDTAKAHERIGEGEEEKEGVGTDAVGEGEGDAAPVVESVRLGEMEGVDD